MYEIILMTFTITEYLWYAKSIQNRYQKNLHELDDDISSYLKVEVSPSSKSFVKGRNNLQRS